MDKSTQIGDVGGSITGVIGVDNVISESFNKIQGAAADDELKAKLTELTAAVAAMCKQLPPDQAQVAARDLQTFTDEATSATPRRSLLAAIGEGLSTTAEAVEKVGAPVVALVKAILLLI